MELNKNKKEVNDPVKNMDLRLKRIDGYNKVFEGQKNRKLAEKDLKLIDLEIESKEFQNKRIVEGLGLDSPVNILMRAAGMVYINNEKTVMSSEPVVECLWEYDEIAEIKHLIMKKLRKL
jgi:hypothetical protein